jgi:peptidyl-prolyl cis-trans isomerase A (cyclophilin A)
MNNSLSSFLDAKPVWALALTVLLAACGGGSSDPEIAAVPEYEVSPSALAYSQKSTFTVSGTALSKVEKITVKKCAGLALEPASNTERKLVSCTVNGSGELMVELKDSADVVLFSKSFTVPEPQVRMTTSLGSMLVELNPTAAPVTVANFMAYVNAGFYTNTLVHRVMPNFVVQGGWLTNVPVVQTGLRNPIVLESNNALSNARGTIGMARTAEANSATSQFYFNLADNLALNYVSPAQPGYAVFGRVIQGLDVMDAIAAVPTGSKYGLTTIPLTDVVVLKVEQVQ